MAFSSDGDIVAVGQADGTVDLWERTSGRMLTSLPTGQGGGGIRVDWSPTEPVLATMAPDFSVVLWGVSNPRRPTVKARLQAGGYPGALSHFLTFSPDGRILVAVNSTFTGATLTFIDAADGRVLRQIRRENVGDVAFSPDSGTLAVGGGTGATLIDVASGETIATRVTDGTNAIAFANGGRWLLTAGWPTEAFPLLIPQGDTSSVPTAPPSATVELWDAKTLRQLGEPITVAGPFPADASANPDGTKVVTGEFVVSSSPDDTAPILWELDPERWAALACEIAGRNLTPTNGRITCLAATSARPANSGRLVASPVSATRCSRGEARVPGASNLARLRSGRRDSNPRPSPWPSLRTTRRHPRRESITRAVSLVTSR